MKLKISAIILLLVILSGKSNVSGQDIEGSMLYTSRIISNPAFTGSSPNGDIRMIYRDYYPGNDFNTGSLYFSYNSFFQKVHGGVGLYIQENHMSNILNDLRAGATYSYHLRAGKDLYVYAGFMASLIHRNLDLSNMIFADQIDPLLGVVFPTGEVIDFDSRTLFDAGVGFLVIYKDYHAGISVNHLAKPDLTGSGTWESRLQRRYTFHASGIFKIGRSEFTLMPMVDLNMQNSLITGSAGFTTGYKLISINTIVHYSPGGGFNSLQAGLFLESGRVGVGYNYYFNPFVSSNPTPFKQSNIVTLIFGLNVVEKRGDSKAINYPKL